MSKKFKGTMKWRENGNDWGDIIYNVEWVHNSEKVGYEVSWFHRSSREMQSYTYDLVEIRDAYTNGQIKIISNETV